MSIGFKCLNTENESYGMDLQQSDAQNNEILEVDVLKQEVELLKDHIMTASLINELTKVMHTSTNTEDTIQTILLGIHEIANFDRIILFDINKNDFSLVPKSWYGLDADQVRSITIPLGFEGGEITDAIFLNRHLIVKEVAAEEDFFAKHFSSREYTVIPLVGRIYINEKEESNNDGRAEASGEITRDGTQGGGQNTQISEDERRRLMIASEHFKTQGVFWMDRNGSMPPITSDDIATLSLIVTQAGVIIDNIRMYNMLQKVNASLDKANHDLLSVNKELREAQDRINKDLENARVIQQGLLPDRIPQSQDIAIEASYTPAAAVSGDYYDAFEIFPGIFVIIVADVSGHGVSSALIMSMVKVLIKTFAFSLNGPQKTLEQINTLFNKEIKTNTFVTIFYSVLDTNKHTFTYCSAGHCPAIFYNKKSQTHTLKKADGLFLGVFEDMILHETSTQYQPHENRVILYTDGLTEAQNDQGEMFELDRLVQIGLKTLSDSPQLACRTILEFQKQFRNTNTFPQDDITLLILDY